MKYTNFLDRTPLRTVREFLLLLHCWKPILCRRPTPSHILFPKPKTNAHCMYKPKHHTPTPKPKPKPKPKPTSKLTMRSHNRINHQRKRRKPTTSNGTRLRPLLCLHRRPRHATAHHGVPHIVLPPILFHEAFRSSENAGDECELSAPVEGFFGGGSKSGSHLFFEGGLGYFFSVDDCCPILLIYQSPK